MCKPLADPVFDIGRDLQIAYDEGYRKGRYDEKVYLADCISRQEAIKVASGYCHPANIADELRKLPPAQPKVIQCKDCKYSAMIYSTNMVPVVGGFRAEGIDPIFCQCDKHGGIEMRWGDFCSRAERRSE